MTEENKYFDRDKNKKLLPVKRTIDTRNELIKLEIDKYNSLLESKKDVKLNNRIIELLEEEYNTSGEIIEIELIPLLHYEHQFIKKNPEKGLDGNIVEDQDSSIVSCKLVSPKFTYEDLRDMKDSTFKTKVITELFNLSFPKLSQYDKTLKKVITQLRKKD